jgi:hypothetical protein
MTENQFNETMSAAQMPSLIAQYKQLDGRIAEINKAVKDLKDKMGYKQVSEQLKPIKQFLYLYMIQNRLKDLSGIKISKVKPSDVKTSEREERIAKKIVDVLDDELDEEQVGEITPLLVEAVLSKK